METSAVTTSEGSGLTQLGGRAELPASPEAAVLESVANPHPGTVYLVRFTCPEFTSLCPVTGQPDFAHLVIDYVPGERIVFQNFGAMEGTQTVTVEPEKGGSKVTHQMDGRLAIPVIGRFLGPMLRRGWKKNIAWGKREMEKQPKVEKATV